MAVDPGLKRAVLRLAVGIVVVDMLFIAIYTLAKIQALPQRQQMMFVAVWTLATLAVVLPGLTAVRRARLRLRAERAGAAAPSRRG